MRLILILMVVVAFQLTSCNHVKKSDSASNTKADTLPLTAFQVNGAEQYIQSILEKGFIEEDGHKLYNPTILKEFYENRNYQPAWTDFHNIEDAFSSIYAIYDDGLEPQDYKYIELYEYYDGFKLSKELEASSYARFDVLLSDALLTSAAHLISGKIHPQSLKSQWEIGVANYKDTYENVASMLQKSIENKKVSVEFEKIKPSHYMYNGLKKALKEFRVYESNGGWNQIPEGNTIKEGDRDPRVVALRRRLLASNEMEPYTPADSLVYDARLVVIMKMVQKKYGIEVDGNFGKGTLEALNIPVEYRIEQIKANLERGRWVLHNLENKYIAVNIPGFELYVIEDGLEVLTSPVMVGQYQTQTPIFKGTMQYLVFNPTWTVPRSLNGKYLQKLKTDLSFFDKENMEVVTYSGKIVDLETTNWKKYTNANFPFMFRQKPGKNNSLGVIKFMFPNEYSIYLHDTPSKGLFSRDIRAFSHGCIRTKEIYSLAEVLLEGNNEGWTTSKIKSEIATGETKTVNLKEKVPILLLYWTAGIGFNQNFYFKTDIYNRDDALIDALNQPFEIQ